MSTFITTINEKRCTGIPRAQKVSGGATTTTAAATSSSFSSSSTSSSTSIASTSTSISISTSTTFSTSSTPSASPTSSTSIPISVTTTSAPAGGFINVPSVDTPTSAAQETSTSTTSFASSQSVIPTSTPISSAIETVALNAPAIPSSTSALVTGSLTTSSTTSSLDPTVVTVPQTTDQGSSSTTQTNDPLALITPGASSGASSSTSAVIGGTIATTTTTGSEQLESSNSGAGLTNGAQNNVSGSAMSTQTTVAVAGGVIGGLALVSIIAFLFWFWRKRLMKKRRSTLLTPLSTGQANGGGEKGPYIISRNSLGPTTIPEKVRAVVGYNYHRLRGRVNSIVTRSPKPSVDLNRGNSQYGLPDTPASRSASGAGVDTNRPTTVKGRFVEWWGRMTEEGNLNWKQRNEPKGGRPNNDTYTSMSNVAQSKRKGSQPDFLTLLSMDEKQQQQQGTSNNTAAGSSNPRRSQSLGNDHFLGGLGLNFGMENPFDDSNAMSHDSAKVKPLAVSGPATSNPFSDANALPAPARPANAGGPATYVQNIRRSRGHSVSAANARPPSNTRMPSMYRESRVSVETSDTRQNKYRSDPFDLDRPELLAQSPVSRPGSSGTRNGYGNGNVRVGLPSAPRPAHARNESFTSKYSSGVSSMGDWSDPGPDVGPAAGRWDTPSPEGALGRLGTGEGNQRNVGKAI
ncbi:hypothetical protein F4679DRAFT_188077 [Xylaria curta]|nr:hypothetical protein F4679DRAFT_188077 [Xylaria curta]